MSFVNTPQMPVIADEEFYHSFNEVSAVQDSLLDYTDKKFALVTIPIERVKIGSHPIVMSDEDIEDNGDVEYIEDLIESVKEIGDDPFPPSVVVDCGDHYEWLDGQHRMTALWRAGVTETTAYVRQR